MMNISDISNIKRINKLFEMNADLGPLPCIQFNTVEKLEEAIGKGVLVVCEFHAYLRYQLDYADYSSHLLHLILLPKKKRHPY